MRPAMVHSVSTTIATAATCRRRTGIGTSTTGSPMTVGAETGKSGAQLWADNCQRCHNARSPGSLSPVQWEVAMMHMRVRANLTPEEHKKILEFLKSSGG